MALEKLAETGRGIIRNVIKTTEKVYVAPQSRQMVDERMAQMMKDAKGAEQVANLRKCAIKSLSKEGKQVRASVQRTTQRPLGTEIQRTAYNGSKSSEFYAWKGANNASERVVLIPNQKTRNWDARCSGCSKSYANEAVEHLIPHWV